jgi:hypothetical protein
VNASGARPNRPLGQLRFLLALLLLLPASLAGDALPLNGPAAIDLVLPFTAAVLVCPAMRRRRAAGLGLGLLSLATFNLIRLAYLHGLALHRSAAFERANTELFRVFMVTLAIVGFLAWARWASDEVR